MADQVVLDFKTPGRRIRFFRLALGLSQEALAKRVHVSQPTLYRWEADKKVPTRRQQVELADVLGVHHLFLYPPEEAA